MAHSATAATPALSVRDLGKIFANTSDVIAGGIHEATFALEPGTFFTLLGPSGCGKTTTLRCIAGLELPDRGTIQLGEQVLFDRARRINVALNRRNIGMVFQSYAIWPHMNVFENVAFPLQVAKDKQYSRDQVTRLVGAALERVNLNGFEARPATRLSGGQQQRVALARAIVGQPSLLLLDEPLSNLDAALREEMRNELKRLQQQVGITTVYVTHDQAEALEMSDLVAVMNKGLIVQMGPPRDIYFRPCDAFVASFVGATNLIPAVFKQQVGGNGLGLVELGDGQSLTCEFQQPRAPAQPVVVSVRPESIALSTPGEPGDSRRNRLQGQVIFAGFLGNMSRYGVRIGANVMQVNTPSGIHFATGAQVVLEFPIEGSLGMAPLGSAP
ncbi:MAG: ABC transporter ATP-binding protein [Burkholderiales bacterium]|nr:ABC transporter ATP-binding protein [Burkholderiales bacterium]